MMVEQKLEALVSEARFDVSSFDLTRGACGSPERFIYHATMPGKGSVPLLKVLLTNTCVNDCAYCANRAGRDCRKYAFKPDELAGLFMRLYSGKKVQGLFLTSGIAGSAARTQELMVQTVDILRNRHEYKGYVHLKILPGAPFDCVEAACTLANRVSINMEAPTAPHLARLSSKKKLYSDIVERMKWIKKLKDEDSHLVPSGQTTQFVVGASGETDRDILRTVSALYSEVNLRRAYFSAFSPVRSTPLENLSPASPRREYRLYQADWLLRIYGFAPNEVELALGGSGNLPQARDPKLVIAEKQPWLFPVDINRASYDELLRVPGIGPVSARRIIQARRDHSIFSLEQLRKMRVLTRQAAPFIWFQGIEERGRQLTLMGELSEDNRSERPSLAALCR